MSLEQMMAELRKDYVASIPEKISAIQQHFQAQKIEDLRNDFHKLKGTGKTYGLPEVSDLGLHVEAICKAGVDDKIKLAIPLAIMALQKIFELRSQQKEATTANVPELQKLLGL